VFGFPDRFSQFIFLGLAFNNSIAFVFVFPDRFSQFIFLEFSFNKSMAFGLPDNQNQSKSSKPFSLSSCIQSFNTYFNLKIVLYFSTII
jgi:hypothetical protein